MSPPTPAHEPLSEDRLRQIRELQERAARAVPAAVQENRDGDWLRHTDSPTTWWAGAALLHGREQPRDLTPAIGAAEDFYAAHRAAPRFQVCPACPDPLDDALSRRGYRRSAGVSLQVATAEQVLRRLSPAPLHVDVEERPTEQWLHLLVAAQQPRGDPAAERRLLQRVEGPSAYVTARLCGHPVAVGRAVVDTGWTGVFAMATLPTARRKGAAVAVLATLAAWACRRGSAQMYLQVTDDSTAALRLYRRAGFSQVCTYHYRVGGVAPDLRRARPRPPSGR